MIAAGHQDGAASGKRQPGADGSANCAGAKNDVASHVPHRNLAQ